MDHRALTVASYNVHQWVGMDWRYDPGRGIKVLQELSASVIGLQEVNFPKRIRHRITEDHLASMMQMELIPGTTLYRKEARYGNALLTRFPVDSILKHDISVGSYEPRGALDVDLDVYGRQVRVVVTHLGLRMRERRIQHARLREILSLRRADLLVLMGDFNEWIPLRFPFRRINFWFDHIHAPRTFPTILPLLALDRIMISPGDGVVSLQTHKSRLSRQASDHYPVKAVIRLVGVPRMGMAGEPGSFRSLGWHDRNDRIQELRSAWAQYRNTAAAAAAPGSSSGGRA
jgi:endonuclease/exonuclease/phosphatase family metal-dependent hydrolase